MGTRNRLNEAYMFLSLVWAAFIGWVFNSWAVFGTVAGVLIALNLIGGNIRPLRGNRFAGRHRFARYRR